MKMVRCIKPKYFIRQIMTIKVSNGFRKQNQEQLLPLRASSTELLTLATANVTIFV